MLWLVGTGISGIESIPINGTEAISCADIIYLEQFTSPAPPMKVGEAGIVEAVRRIAGGGCKIREAERCVVEDGTEILQNARSQNVVLLSYGDPLVATTHTELRCRAAASGIRTRVIHASSAPAAAIGECGLHHYKMGRMATIMRDPRSMTTPYYTVYKNATERCHTLLLLEYDHEGTEEGDGRRFVLEPTDALRGLLKTEEGQRRGVILDNTYAVVASRIGLADQHITAGRISSLVAREEKGFGEPPHSIIIPGSLHFTESDALDALAECIDPPPRDGGDGETKNGRNPNVPARIPEQMVTKYAPMIRRSISDVLPHCTGSEAMERILENARLYVDDAEDFVKKEGHGDVAVLSIGYADGLADALRLLKGLDAVDVVGGGATDTRHDGSGKAGPKLQTP